MIEYNRGNDRRGTFVLIVIKDENDNKIFSRRINLKNHQEYFDTMMSIAEKYGFKPEIQPEDSVNTKEQIKKDKFDWLS